MSAKITDDSIDSFKSIFHPPTIPDICKHVKFVQFKFNTNTIKSMEHRVNCVFYYLWNTRKLPSESSTEGDQYLKHYCLAMLWVMNTFNYDFFYDQIIPRLPSPIIMLNTSDYYYHFDNLLKEISQNYEEAHEESLSGEIYQVPGKNLAIDFIGRISDDKITLDDMNDIFDGSQSNEFYKIEGTINVKHMMKGIEEWYEQIKDIRLDPEESSIRNFANKFYEHTHQIYGKPTQTIPIDRDEDRMDLVNDKEDNYNSTKDFYYIDVMMASLIDLYKQSTTKGYDIFERNVDTHRIEFKNAIGKAWNRLKNGENAESFQQLLLDVVNIEEQLKDQDVNWIVYVGFKDKLVNYIAWCQSQSWLTFIKAALLLCTKNDLEYIQDHIMIQFGGISSDNHGKPFAESDVKLLIAALIGMRVFRAASSKQMFTKSQVEIMRNIMDHVEWFARDKFNNIDGDKTIDRDPKIDFKNFTFSDHPNIQWLVESYLDYNLNPDDKTYPNVAKGTKTFKEEFQLKYKECSIPLPMKETNFNLIPYKKKNIIDDVITGRIFNIIDCIGSCHDIIQLFLVSKLKDINSNYHEGLFPLFGPKALLEKELTIYIEDGLEDTLVPPLYSEKMKLKTFESKQDRSALKTINMRDIAKECITLEHIMKSIATDLGLKLPARQKYDTTALEIIVHQNFLMLIDDSTDLHDYLESVYRDENVTVVEESFRKYREFVKNYDQRPYGEKHRLIFVFMESIIPKCRELLDVAMNTFLSTNKMTNIASFNRLGAVKNNESTAFYILRDLKKWVNYITVEIWNTDKKPNLDSTGKDIEIPEKNFTLHGQPSQDYPFPHFVIKATKKDGIKKMQDEISVTGDYDPSRNSLVPLFQNKLYIDIPLPDKSEQDNFSWWTREKIWKILGPTEVKLFFDDNKGDHMDIESTFDTSIAILNPRAIDNQYFQASGDDLTGTKKFKFSHGNDVYLVHGFKEMANMGEIFQKNERECLESSLELLKNSNRKNVTVIRRLEEIMDILYVKTDAKHINGLMEKLNKPEFVPPTDESLNYYYLGPLFEHIFKNKWKFVFMIQNEKYYTRFCNHPIIQAFIDASLYSENDMINPIVVYVLLLTTGTYYVIGENDNVTIMSGLDQVDYGIGDAKDFFTNDKPGRDDDIETDL